MYTRYLSPMFRTSPEPRPTRCRRPFPSAGPSRRSGCRPDGYAADPAMVFPTLDNTGSVRRSPTRCISRNLSDIESARTSTLMTATQGRNFGYPSGVLRVPDITRKDRHSMGPIVTPTVVAGNTTRVEQHMRAGELQTWSESPPSHRSVRDVCVQQRGYFCFPISNSILNTKIATMYTMVPVLLTPTLRWQSSKDPCNQGSSLRTDPGEPANSLG